jgi:chromosome segregation ATPase
MDYKQLVNFYQAKYKETESLVFELQSRLADCSHCTELKDARCRINELEDALAKRESKSATSTAVKEEAAATPAPEPDATRLADVIQQVDSLKHEMTTYANWVDELVIIIGVDAQEVPSTVRAWKESIENSKDIEKALRKQVNNSNKKAVDLVKKIEKVENQRDKALSDVQKYKAQVSRAKLGRSVTGLYPFH